MLSVVRIRPAHDTITDWPLPRTDHRPDTEAPSWLTSTIDDGAGGQPTTTEFRARVDGELLTAHIKGNGTKVGTDWYVGFTDACLPDKANTASTAIIGPAHAYWASNDHNGTVKWEGDNILFVFDSDRTIADNQVLSGVSAVLQYEID